MSFAPHRENELSVQEALRSLEVLDTEPEAEFDALVQALALVCDVPVSFLTLVDANRQWFKASVGMAGLSETSREISFCAHAVLGQEIMEIFDAKEDARFADNPFVIGEPNVRFYAGAPIRLTDGSNVGSLCVLDRKPRQLTEQQRQVLAQLAIAAGRALEGRRATRRARQISASLAASEARFRSLSDSSPMGVFHADAQGLFTYSNQRFQEIFGLSERHSLDVRWTQSVHPLDRGAVFAAWRAAVDQHARFELECRLLRRDVSAREVLMSASPVRNTDDVVIGYVGAVEDRTAQTRLRAVLDRTGRLAAVGGWEFDLRTMEVTWTEQTRILHEAEPGFQPTFEQAMAFFDPGSASLLNSTVKAGIDRGATVDLELSLVTAKGNRRWVRAIGEVEREDGKAVRLVGALQDVTEQRRDRLELQREQALRLKIEQQSHETERLLRERSDMLDVLAHEIRQPLNNASAALQGAAIALHGAGDQIASNRLVKAQAVMGQVLASIDNNLAVASLLARQSPIQRADTDIDLLLELSRAELPSLDRARVQIVRHTGTRTASMDMSLMLLAIRNLLANALRYSEPGSTVSLHVHDLDEPLALVIDVASVGGPIPADILPTLFKRGAHGSRDRSGHGMGLGLYIVRRVMELHGGSTEVAGNDASGVTMRLKLVPEDDD